MRIFCIAKDFYIFPTKNNSTLVIFTFEILTKQLNNDAVNFEQSTPVYLQVSSFYFISQVYNVNNMRKNMHIIFAKHGKTIQCMSG